MIAAVVLNTGLSHRLCGRNLPETPAWAPLVRWSVEGVQALVDDVVVVTGPDESAVRDALAGLRVRFAINPRPEDGQGTSIATGVGVLAPETEAALVVLGDQPWLPADVVPALVTRYRHGGAAIVAPVYRGAQGNPVLFAASVFGELAALGGDAGARQVVQRDPARVARVELDVDMPDDVDTPDDLERLTAARARRVE